MEDARIDEHGTELATLEQFVSLSKEEVVHVEHDDPLIVYQVPRIELVQGQLESAIEMRLILVRIIEVIHAYHLCTIFLFQSSDPSSIDRYLALFPKAALSPASRSYEDERSPRNTRRRGVWKRVRKAEMYLLHLSPALGGSSRPLSQASRGEWVNAREGGGEKQRFSEVGTELGGLAAGEGSRGGALKKAENARTKKRKGLSLSANFSFRSS